MDSSVGFIEGHWGTIFSHNSVWVIGTATIVSGLVWCNIPVLSMEMVTAYINSFYLTRNLGCNVFSFFEQCREMRGWDFRCNALLFFEKCCSGL